VEDAGRFTLAVAHDIRNQYTLAYSPLNQTLDGAFRQIKVSVNAASRPQVRTRTGYYATPELAKTSQARPAAAQARPG
jgi:Ca-activated chloride channel homolog